MRHIALGLVLLSACGDDGTTDGDAGSDVTDAGVADAAVADAAVIVDLETTMPGAAPIAPSADCTVTTWRQPSGPRDHREPCSPLDYPVHPPSSGPHYGVWADFGVYDAAVPWPYLVHSLEHGAVVFAYDCPSGCPDVVAAFEAIVTDRGDDPMCATNADTASRFIIVPDPALEDGSFAAVAWEHAYVATCLDETSLAAFVDAHYAMAPEDLCAAGRDDSATGWCD